VRIWSFSVRDSPRILTRDPHVQQYPGPEKTYAHTHARTQAQTDVLFCSLAVLDPRVGYTMDALSPFISVLSF